jgi:hypothetical protein
LTPNTVMVTLSPIMRDSPTRRVNINMVHILVQSSRS